MNKYIQQKDLALKWLSQDTLPLWMEKGVDREGGFAESISLEGVPQFYPRRVMVQARQIYALRTASEMGLLAKDSVTKAVAAGIRALIRNFSLPSGAFVHSLTKIGQPAKAEPDLYSQAFCLFGLANAYALTGDTELKSRAKLLLKYLDAERKVTGGGYTELADGAKLYQSNPHMHLFEASLWWMEADGDPAWRNLADNTLKLCLTKFVDPATKLIGEHFDENWNHQRAGGKFVYEPGHQYEWSWLMGRYQNLTKVDLMDIREQLFANGDRPGLCPKRQTAFDEVWSDFSVKSSTSRFWPQCERIKVASQLGKLDAAAQSMDALFQFFATKYSGLWYDIWDSAQGFREQPAKASSLYHIVGAIEQYSRALE